MIEKAAKNKNITPPIRVTVGIKQIRIYPIEEMDGESIIELVATYWS